MTDNLTPEPCPWCGHMVRVNENRAQVACSVCKAWGPEGTTAAAAVAVWNRVCRLAKRGAEVEGAREAWIDWSEAQDVCDPNVCVGGIIYGDKQHTIDTSPDGSGPVYRVLILPDAGEKGDGE